MLLELLEKMKDAAPSLYPQVTELDIFSLNFEC